MATPRKDRKQKQKAEQTTEKKPAEAKGLGKFIKPANYVKLVALFAALIYIGTLGHGYVYDDEIVIQKNVFVQDGIAGISDIWSHNYVTEGGFNDGLYRPLSPTMFAIEVDLFGDNPWIGHLMNILMYALVCAIVFLFVKKLTGGNDTLALIAGLLYAAHPIHTEVVANIKSRDEIMAALFGFAAMYLVIKDKELTLKNTIIAGGLLLLALFSKESAIAFAVAIPMVYYFKNREIKKPLITLGAVMALITIPWYALHEHIIDSMTTPVDEGLFSGLSNAVLMTENKADQMATGFLITMHYVWKSIIPYPLVNDYSPNAIVAIKLASSTGLFCLAVLGGLFSYGAYLFLKKNSIAGLGILIFFLLLAPVANVFLPIGTTMGERLAFAPSLGVVLALVALYDYLKLNAKPYMVGGLVAIFSVMTVARAAQWESNLKLYEVDVKSQPNSFRTHYNYATALNKSVGDRTGDDLTSKDRESLNKSVKHFEAALEMKPHYADAILNLGNAYRRLGNPAKAKELYTDLINIKPEYTKAVFNLAVTYYEEKNYEPAHRYFIQYLNINGPMKAMAWYSAGVCSGYLGQFDDAIKELNNSIALDSKKWDAWNYLGMAYGNSNQREKAVTAFQTAYDLSKSEDVKNNLEHAKRALAETAGSN